MWNNIKEMYCNSTYQLVKTKKNEEKIVMETDASCIERAIDYFYLCKPKSYGNPNYIIRIKKGNFADVAREWD